MHPSARARASRDELVASTSMCPYFEAGALGAASISLMGFCRMFSIIVLLCPAQDRPNVERAQDPDRKYSQLSAHQQKKRRAFYAPILRRTTPSAPKSATT